jgi:hypothetical protein
MRPPENSRDFTAEQCQVLLEHIGPMLLYLRKLLNRIEQLRFPADDSFRREVQEAYNTMHNLRVGLHYMTCNAMKREQAAKPHRRPWEGQERDTYWESRQKRKG